jgi:hypothetical protein
MPRDASELARRLVEGSAAITCPTGGGRAATGRWATFAIRPAGRCSSGLADRYLVPGAPGIGRMPPRPNTAISST